MIPAWSITEIIEELNRAFDSRYPGTTDRMVGLLFAPPESNLGSSEIIPSLEYFHYRSGNKVDIFCSGYRRYGKEQQHVVEKEVTSDRSPWIFNVLDFESLRKEVENKSKWRYSGEADLILLTARKKNPDRNIVLDWSSAICCDLEKMKSDKVIESTRRFFEDIFRFVDGYEGERPVWDFSDERALRTAKSGLKKVVLSLLPEQLAGFYDKAQHLVVRDISYDRTPPYQLSDLKFNGDFIVAIHQLMQLPDEKADDSPNTRDLEEQLNSLLSVAGIKLDSPLLANAIAISESPIVSLRAAKVAGRLARNSQGLEEYRLNLLRRDILLVVAGLNEELDPNVVTKGLADYRHHFYCLLGAMADVAATAPKKEKPAAMRAYSRIEEMTLPRV